MDFEGRINESGEFIPDNKNKYNKTLRSLTGRRVILSLVLEEDITPLYRFYKYMVHRIADELGYLDNELEAVIIDKFAYSTIWDNGKPQTVFLDPKEMKYNEMKVFVERIKKWARYDQNIEL